MNWLEVLRTEVEKRNDRFGRGGRVLVGKMMGYSRSAVSTALSGKYPADINRFLARVMEVFGSGHVMCPHLRAELAIVDCRHWRTRPMPHSNPDHIRHWIACDTCPIGAALGGVPRASTKRQLPVTAGSSPAASSKEKPDAA